MKAFKNTNEENPTHQKRSYNQVKLLFFLSLQTDAHSLMDSYLDTYAHEMQRQ